MWSNSFYYQLETISRNSFSVLYRCHHTLPTFCLALCRYDIFVSYFVFFYFHSWQPFRIVGQTKKTESSDSHRAKQANIYHDFLSLITYISMSLNVLAFLSMNTLCLINCQIFNICPYFLAGSVVSCCWLCLLGSAWLADCSHVQRTIT